MFPNYYKDTHNCLMFDAYVALNNMRSVLMQIEAKRTKWHSYSNKFIKICKQNKLMKNPFGFFTHFLHIVGFFYQPISQRSFSMNDKTKLNRRNLLIGTGVMGLIGVGFASVPFLKSWMPSERAKASGGPVKADVSKLEAGQMISVQWRGQPVFIVNRSSNQVEVLDSLKDKLKDPESESSIQPGYINNIFRAQKENMLVVIGICTHLGCVPKYYPELVPQQFDSQWKGGFFCPCHSSRFDISGRVFKGSPASRNLDIPPHQYIDAHTIEIGIDQEQV